MNTSSLSNKFVATNSISSQQQGMPSSSYGSSFSEHVNIIGNQIQIVATETEPIHQPVEFVQTDSNTDSSLSNLAGNNRFTLRFSERELREWVRGVRVLPKFSFYLRWRRKKFESHEEGDGWGKQICEKFKISSKGWYKTGFASSYISFMKFTHPI